MLIIDIIISLVVLVTLATYFSQSSSKEHFLIYTGKDCENIGIGENRCSGEERKIYDLYQKLEKAKRMSLPRSPLISKNYKNFFKKKNIGVKPNCYKQVCYPFGSRKKRKNFLNYVNDYIKWQLNKKLYIEKEIPIEMSFYKTLKKIEDVIGTRRLFRRTITNDLHPYDLRSNKKITNRKHLKKLIPKMIRAKILFNKKSATFVFKLKPADKKKLYWINVSNEKEFFYIDNLLKENNIVVTTSELC